MEDGAKYVLDTYALMTLLEDESGAQTVAEILASEKTKAYLSMVNLGEAYYILLRRKGDEAAEDLLEGIFNEQSLCLVEVPWSRIKEAARIKSRGGLSYADSFALALALELKAPLVTGDPELRSMAEQLSVGLVWIGVVE